MGPLQLASCVQFCVCFVQTEKRTPHTETDAREYAPMHFSSAAKVVRLFRRAPLSSAAALFWRLHQTASHNQLPHESSAKPLGRPTDTHSRPLMMTLMTHAPHQLCFLHRPTGRGHCVSFGGGRSQQTRGAHAACESLRCSLLECWQSG